jgi:hypothetical protein
MIQLPALDVLWLDISSTTEEPWQIFRRARPHVTGYGRAGRHYGSLRVPEARSPRADHSHPISRASRAI